MDIGTIRMYIDNRVLGGRKLVEAAVVESNMKETLISLDLLKKWDLVHESFLFQTVFQRKINVSKLTPLRMISTQIYMKKVKRLGNLHRNAVS